MKRIAYSDVVCLCCVRPHYHKNAHNDAEQVCYCPPSEVWEVAFDSGDDGGDESDEPSKLSEVLVSFVFIPCGQLSFVKVNIRMLSIWLQARTGLQRYVL